MTDEEFVPWHRPSPLLTAIGGFCAHATDPLRAGSPSTAPRRTRGDSSMAE